jgi:hypothetical protein
LAIDLATGSAVNKLLNGDPDGVGPILQVIPRKNEMIKLFHLLIIEPECYLCRHADRISNL